MRNDIPDTLDWTRETGLQNLTFAVQETGVSRHNGGLIESPPQYDSAVMYRGCKMVSSIGHLCYRERLVSRTAIRWSLLFLQTGPRERSGISATNKRTTVREDGASLHHRAQLRTLENYRKSRQYGIDGFKGILNEAPMKTKGASFFDDRWPKKSSLGHWKWK